MFLKIYNYTSKDYGGLGLWCLTPLSTTFQLYHGDQLKPNTKLFFFKSVNNFSILILFIKYFNTAFIVTLFWMVKYTFCWLECSFRTFYRCGRSLWAVMTDWTSVSINLTDRTSFNRRQFTVVSGITLPDWFYQSIGGTVVTRWTGDTFVSIS